MKFSALRNYSIIFLILVVIAGFHFITDNFTTFKPHKIYASSLIQHVFIIAMENHDWRDIKGNTQAPYINNTLLPMSAHAEQYYNPPNNHPSAPNYVWLEAGAAPVGQNDCAPTDSGCSTNINHLSKLLDAANISWKEYAEDASGTNCILNFSTVDINHVPFSYFTDVTNNNNSTSANCISHERPFTQLITDLQNNTVAHYNFITPNLTDDMHNGTIQQGDAWLSQQVPVIMNSQAYKNGGVIFITWDEGEGDDGPIGMIVISSFAKKNYANNIHYDHSSTLKTLEEIFGVGPLLGGAANATDLSDLFTVPLTGTGGTNPMPSTIYCVGGNAQPPCATVPPSGTSTNPPTITPSIPPTISTAPKQNPCVTGTQATSVKIKKHTRQNGAISNLLLLLLQFLIQLLQQLTGGTITFPLIGSPTPTETPTTNPTPTITPCITLSPNGSTVPSASINPSITGGSSMGPTTSLHYAANSNFSGSTYSPGTFGFNLIDAENPTDVANTPSSDKALVWVGTCNGADATFTATIQPYIGNPKVFGFYLMDEPDPTGQYKTICTRANLKAESDWIHKKDPGTKTFIILMNMSSSSNPSYTNTYNSTNSAVDLYGLDPYPCRTELKGCDYTYITKAVAAAKSSGIPLANIVPVYQTFGLGSWTDDGGGQYAVPTAAQEQQILSNWATTVPHPVFDYAYSWGKQNGDTSLSSLLDLQQIFSIHNK